MRVRNASFVTTKFLNDLSSLRFANVFNPYSDVCPEHDTSDAPGIRRHNLELVLRSAVERGVDSIWIARDLGYRGGRRTGLALTDEVHLTSHAALLATPPLRRATIGPVVGERTACLVWRALSAINRPIFLWNVFPFHPHEPDEPMSNRGHTGLERAASRPLLLWLLETLRPHHVVAIGRDAQKSLRDLEIDAVAIRHPSYGGQNEFLSGLASLYRVSIDERLSQPQLI